MCNVSLLVRLRVEITLSVSPYTHALVSLLVRLRVEISDRSNGKTTDWSASS